jgi:hypothetical protein
MRKLRNFNIYPTVYHLHHLEKGFENRSKSSFFVHIGTFRIFKIEFETCKICKKFQHKKVAVFHYLSNGISFAQFRKTVEFFYRNYRLPVFFNTSRFRYFQNYSKTVKNLKKLKRWKRCKFQYLTNGVSFPPFE